MITLIERFDFVFGYGSLVNVKNLEQYLKRKLKPDADYKICSLKNFQRCWNVAMDNRVDLPSYKYYCDRQSGIRLNSFVTFLNIRPYPDNIISGILFRVSGAELKNLDLRERNYQRIDITNQLNIQVEGNAWTYVGLKEAEQRYQTGFSKGNAVISQDYLDLVQNAYFSLGNKQYIDYIDTTDKPMIPVVDLEKYAIELM